MIPIFVEDFMGIRDTDPEPVSAPGETKIPTAQTPPDQTIEPGYRRNRR